MPPKDEILKNIRQISPKFCDNCGQKYVPKNFKVLKVNDKNALVHLTCDACANTYVINALINHAGFGSQRVPLVLDIQNGDEVEKFANSESVDQNSAIDLFNFLSKNDTLDSLFPTGEKLRHKKLDANNIRNS